MFKTLWPLLALALALALFAALASGCTDGQLGNSKALRFGLQVQYPDYNGFGPIARGQTMKLAVQGAVRPALLNDYEYLESTLTVTAPDGQVNELSPSEPGKFTTIFTSTGAYVLTAALPNGTSDSLTVNVVEQTGLRLSLKNQTVNTYRADGSFCSKDEVGSLKPQLKKNQDFEASLVPVDSNDAPLLGLLATTFSGAVDVHHGSLSNRANTWSFRPLATGASLLEVIDLVTGQKSTVEFDVSEEEASCPAR